MNQKVDIGKCLISYKAWQKIQYYIQNIDAEISGWGKTEIVDGNIRVLDVVIFKQTVSAATTALDLDARAKFLFELKQKGEDPKDWNLWWHSHNTMNVFWSSTDDTAVKNEIGSIPFLLSIVSNKKKEILTRMDFTMVSESPFSVGFVQKTIDKIPTDIEPVEIPDATMNVYTRLSDEYDAIKDKIDKLTEQMSSKVDEINSLIEPFEEDKELEEEIRLEISEKVTSNTYNKPKWSGKDFFKKKNERYYSEEEYFNSGISVDGMFPREEDLEELSLSEYIQGQFQEPAERESNTNIEYRFNIIKINKQLNR